MELPRPDVNPHAGDLWAELGAGERRRVPRSLCGRGDLAQFLEHDLGVSTGVGDLIDLRDSPFGVDQKGHAPGEIGILLVWFACDAVGATYIAIDVGQQSKTELFVRGECLVVGGGVERRADDFGVECFEFWASVTEALAFACSTAGRGFGVPPQHDP